MARRAGNAEQIAVEDSLQEVTILKLIFYSRLVARSLSEIESAWLAG